MGLSYPLGINCFVPAKAKDGWIVGIVMFLRFYGTRLDFVSDHKNAKNNMADIQPPLRPHAYSITHITCMWTHSVTTEMKPIRQQIRPVLIFETVRVTLLVTQLYLLLYRQLSSRIS